MEKYGNITVSSIVILYHSNCIKMIVLYNLNENTTKYLLTFLNYTMLWLLLCYQIQKIIKGLTWPKAHHITSTFNHQTGAPPWSSGSMLDDRSLPPEFESQHIWRLFHLWLRLITFGGRSAHLAYLMHRSGHKTPIIIIF